MTSFVTALSSCEMHHVNAIRECDMRIRFTNAMYEYVDVILLCWSPTQTAFSTMMNTANEADLEIPREEININTNNR